MNERLDLKLVVIVLSLVMQIVGGAYAYGKMSERVDTLQRDVLEIRTIILQTHVGRN